MSFSHSLLSKIASNANKKLVIKPDDFINNDGLWTCHICNKPMQTVISECSIKVFTPCDCNIKSIREYDDMIKTKLKNDIINSNRINAFPTPNMRSIRFVENPQNSVQLLTMINYASNFALNLPLGQGLLLSGSSGSGKTFYSVCIANSIIDNGFSAKFVSINYLFNSKIPKSDIFSSLDKFDLVVFDDLCLYSSSNPLDNFALEILNHRYNLRKPMIVTSNIDVYKIINDISNNSDNIKPLIFDKILDVCTPVILRTRKRKNLKNINIIDDKSKLYNYGENYELY